MPLTAAPCPMTEPQVSRALRERFLGRAATLLLLGLALGLAACAPEHEARLAPGQPFPDLSLTSLDGAPMETAGLDGRVLVLNVWATWCPPCRREMPSLQRLAAAVDPRRVMIAGLTVDRDLNLAREFVLQNRIAFPNYADPDMAIANGSLAVVGFPETFIVGPDGRLAARVVGPREWDAPEILGALQALSRGERASFR